MDHWDILFERELLLKVNSMLQTEHDFITNAASFDEFKQRCGRISAIREIKSEMEAIRDAALGKTKERN